MGMEIAWILMPMYPSTYGHKLYAPTLFTSYMNTQRSPRALVTLCYDIRVRVYICIHGQASQLTVEVTLYAGAC